MKTITLFLRDGSSRVAAVVDDSFDVENWLRQRFTAAQLLDVVKVEAVTYAELDSGQGCD